LPHSVYYKTKIKTKTGAVLNHLPASACRIRQCNKLQQVVKFKARVTASPHVRTVVRLLMLAVRPAENKVKKMLSVRSFHSDQNKTGITSPRPRTKPARPRPRPKPYSAGLRPVL